ncbi:MAG: TerD family protein [Clostridia bacterium]|nr:TerD family protein [Clostridia bacterium]
MALPKKTITTEVVGTFEKAQEVEFAKDLLVKGSTRLTMKWGKGKTLGAGLKKKLAAPVDLDLSLFGCNANYECVNMDGINFFAHLESLGGAVKHSPDARDGGGEEWIDVDFSKLPAEIEVLVITASNFNGNEHLGMVNDAEIIINYGDGGELKCPISENAELENHKAAAFVIFEKKSEESWSLKVEPTIIALNEQQNAENLEGLCLYFGLDPAALKAAYPGC